MKLDNEKIESFIESLYLPKDSRVLFQSFNDCQTFFSNYYMRNSYLIDDILDFRDFKIKSSDKTVDKFIEECYNKGMKSAFESTFYQSFADEYIDLINEAISNNIISLSQLYEEFKKNPHKNILKNVL